MHLLTSAHIAVAQPKNAEQYTYAILDWRKNSPELKEEISWLEIFEIRRKDPPCLKTKATEKSPNLKIKHKKI